MFLPSGVKLVSASGSPSQATSSAVQWVTAIAAQGAAVYTVDVAVPAGATGPLSASAWAYPTPAGSIDPDASKALATVSTAIGSGTAAQTVSFTSKPPTVSATGETGVGQAYTPVAAASSKLPVSVSVDPASTAGACTMASGKVTFTGAGSCVLDANQAGDATFEAAPQVQQKVVVHAVAQLATSLSAPSSVAPGSTLSYTVRVPNSGPGNASGVSVEDHVSLPTFDH